MTHLDPLSDVLRILRVGGSLVLNDTYLVPWAVQVPRADRLAELTAIAPDRVVAFHFVQQGRLQLTDEHGGVVRAGPGDLLVCFGGGPHQLSCGTVPTPAPLESLIGLPDTPDAGVRPDQAATSLLCGVFSLGALETTPLAEELPGMVHLRGGTGGDFDTLARLLAFEVAARRPGMDFTIGRILELICAEALRHVANTSCDGQRSWLRALNDPPVFAAMTAVHDDPGRDWDVRALADAAALSPSRLTARFREKLGRSPMAYVTMWRMVLAAELLDDTDLSVQRIAEQVGYTAQPSFTRSFTRHHGISPREYRTTGRGRRSVARGAPARP